MTPELAGFLCSVWTVVLVLVLVSYWSPWNWRHPGKRLPPGPRGLPMVGHLFSFKRSDLSDGKCMEWAKTYGPIVRIKLGSYNVIFLNDYRSIKRYMSRREILHRPASATFLLGDNEGKKFIDKHWKERRRFNLFVLRNLGFGKIPMETHIQKELEGLSDLIAGCNGAPVRIHHYLMQSASNVIAAFLFGHGFPVGDPRRDDVDRRLRSAMNVFDTGFTSEYFPAWLKKIYSNVIFTKSTNAGDLAGLTELCRNEIAEHKRSLNEEYDRDFIDTFLKKMKEQEGLPEPAFTEFSLLSSIFGFFLAGTTAAFEVIHWNLINCARHPDTVQSRILKEINDATHGERQPQLQDRKNLPYTMACLWEIFRMKSFASVARAAGEDTFFDEYFIPKGSVVIPNVWAVHRNPNLWKDPHMFKPERFLNEDGSALLPKPEYIISFSVGPMMCPAETFATAEVFLTVTALLQRFRVLLGDGSKFDIESLDLTSADLPDSRLRFETR